MLMRRRLYWVGHVCQDEWYPDPKWGWKRRWVDVVVGDLRKYEFLQEWCQPQTLFNEMLMETVPQNLSPLKFKCYTVFLHALHILSSKYKSFFLNKEFHLRKPIAMCHIHKASGSYITMYIIYL